MKKISKLFLALLAIFALAACTTQEDIQKPIDIVEVDISQDPDYTVYSGNENNVILTSLSGNDTRAGFDFMNFGNKKRADKPSENQPSIPGDAKEMDTETVQDGRYMLQDGKTYKISAGHTVNKGIDMRHNGHVTVYVEGTWTAPSDHNGNGKFTIYVLDTGTLNWRYDSDADNILKIGNGSSAIIKVWGKINPLSGDNKTISKLWMKENSQLWIYSDKSGPMTIDDIYVEGGSHLYINVPVTTNKITGNSGAGTLLEFGSTFHCTGNCTSNAASNMNFYGDALFDGDIEVNSNVSYNFYKDFHCGGNVNFKDNSNSNFYKCAKIDGNFTLLGNNSVINIYESLTIGGTFSFDGNTINLHEALLNVLTEIILKDAGSINSNETGYTSILKATKINVDNFQENQAADIFTLKKNLYVICPEDNLYTWARKLNSITWWNGSANVNVWNAIAKIKLSDRNVIFNPSVTDYYLPATDCRQQIGTPPTGGGGTSGDQGGGTGGGGTSGGQGGGTGGGTSGDNDPIDPVVTEPANHVEINLHLGEHKDWNESKLSIHIRYNTDVEVYIPVTADLICEQDDMYIVQKHWQDGAFVYNSQPKTVSMAIGEETVSFTIEYVMQATATKPVGIYIKTEGMTQNILDICRRTFGDGLTFEIYNYYNFFTQDENGNVSGMVDRDDILECLNGAKVTFTHNPKAYINAFNFAEGSTTNANVNDCTVTPTDRTNFPTGVETGFHKNKIYWRGGTAPSGN